jgi:hypothetical protein
LAQLLPLSLMNINREEISMLSTRLHTASLLSLVCLASLGCHRYLYSPPTQISVADGPASIGKNNTMVSGQYQHGGTLFGPDIEGGALRVRHGVTETQDVSLTATTIFVRESEYDADTDRSKDIYHPIVAGRVGTKWSPRRLEDHFALNVGLGMGWSKGGAYVSPDVGLVAGWTNSVVTPFYAVSGFVSQPFRAKSVDLA